MKPLFPSDIPKCCLRNLLAKSTLERYFQVSLIHRIFLQAEFIFKVSAYLLVQEKDAKCHSYQLLNTYIWSIWKVLQKFETVNIFASCRKIRLICLKCYEYMSARCTGLQKTWLLFVIYYLESTQQAIGKKKNLFTKKVHRWWVVSAFTEIELEKTKACQCLIWLN